MVLYNKVLVVTVDPDLLAALEESLQEIADEGGELFFASDIQTALVILEKASPQLVFWDTLLHAPRLKQKIKKAHLVYLADRHEMPGEEVLTKPIKPRQVLEKCRQHLKKKIVSPLPPM